MSEITREILSAYLDDSLSTAEIAEVEKALPSSDTLRRQLKQILTEIDRGEHTVGAIWRRERLTCPDRDQLGMFLMQGLEDEFQDYIQFHLEIIGCPFCQANLTDLKSMQKSSAPDTKRRRKHILDSSIGIWNTPNEST